MNVPPAEADHEVRMFLGLSQKGKPVWTMAIAMGGGASLVIQAGSIQAVSDAAIAAVRASEGHQRQPWRGGKAA